MSLLTSTLDHPAVTLDSLGRPRRPLAGAHSQCAGCSEFFGSDSAFAKHRRGEAEVRRCRTPDDMRDAGMAISVTGWWATRPRPDTLRE